MSYQRRRDIEMNLVREGPVTYQERPDSEEHTVNAILGRPDAVGYMSIKVKGRVVARAHWTRIWDSAGRLPVPGSDFGRV